MRNVHKALGFMAWAVAFVLLGCGAHRPPQELTDARTAYARVSAGPAAQYAPDELHKAQVALGQAEQAFLDNPDGPVTRDLGYVAQRKAMLAEALAGVVKAERQKAGAENERTRAMGSLQQKTEQELASAKQRLVEAERQKQIEAERRVAEDRLDAEATARAEAERKAEVAMQDLARIAQLREEERGQVVSLPSDLLFTSNESILLPSAQMKLNDLADALAKTDNRLIIEGHTDNRGNDGYNQGLSLRRADAVRAYLVSRGVTADRIQVNALGESRPVADNRTAEGRANNRRVEIIVERQSASAH